VSLAAFASDPRTQAIIAQRVAYDAAADPSGRAAIDAWAADFRDRMLFGVSVREVRPHGWSLVPGGKR